MSPLWIAFLLGLMVGWAWKPRWISSVISKLQSLLFSSPALVSPLVIIKDLTSAQSSNSLQVQTTRIDSSVLNGGLKKKQLVKLKTEESHSLRLALNIVPELCTRMPPEMLRDFYWDDDFRLKWNDIILHAETVKECSTMRTMIVQWIRKFPYFCSDREYIIGHRIWEAGRSYYCVTKAFPTVLPSVAQLKQ